mmetsp:Transcript_41732/g.79728  ORF Transcript_41732/g.79728 Transcript_41732/m.79728 type:complete len:289 (+) Transcript_41732:322-1188(+)
MILEYGRLYSHYQELCLVYELCARESLETCLPQLRWNDRVRVALEVCRATLFLHKRKPNGVIHQSIKPSNVLLDNNWNAKLSDVGHGKILRRKYSTDTVRSSRADPGYVMSPKHKAASAYTDPEYLTSSKVSFSSDVFSLGLLMLYMITGKPAVGELTSRDIAEDALASENDSFVDESAGQWPINHARSFIKLALRCVARRTSGRPDLESDVLPKLEELYAECQIHKAVDETHTEGTVCVVCMSEPATHAYLPCGHRCVCEHDVDGMVLRGMVCPICRAQATDIIRIY